MSRKERFRVQYSGTANVEARRSSRPSGGSSPFVLLDVGHGQGNGSGSRQTSVPGRRRSSRSKLSRRKSGASQHTPVPLAWAPPQHAQHTSGTQSESVASSSPMSSRVQTALAEYSQLKQTTSVSRATAPEVTVLRQVRPQTASAASAPDRPGEHKAEFEHVVKKLYHRNSSLMQQLERLQNACTTTVGAGSSSSVEAGGEAMGGLRSPDWREEERGGPDDGDGKQKQESPAVETQALHTHSRALQKLKHEKESYVHWVEVLETRLQEQERQLRSRPGPAEAVQTPPLCAQCRRRRIGPVSAAAAPASSSASGFRAVDYEAHFTFLTQQFGARLRSHVGKLMSLTRTGTDKTQAPVPAHAMVVIHQLERQLIHETCRRVIEQVMRNDELLQAERSCAEAKVEVGLLRRQLDAIKRRA